jgi:hypothetical protein
MGLTLSPYKFGFLKIPTEALDEEKDMKMENTISN